MSIIDAVSCMLEIYLDQTALSSYSKTFFHSKKIPRIPIGSYLNRLKQYMKCSEECYVLALIYIDRISTKHNSFVVNSLCIHRLILAAVMLSAKFSEDKFYKNSYYAKVGGISCTEMNSLEHQFLIMIEFDLYVSEKEFQLYLSTLINNFGISQNEVEDDVNKNHQEIVQEELIAKV
ncbi:unnamed protein product [Blepharisma stoltei]|uniref:Cyclin n=1 Tax=Blepharisma stoltei TaxID=1481888 RepID=A0AAU9JB21_9CILI|nr:unnamed protein product [Blepharisma stoltei]